MHRSNSLVLLLVIVSLYNSGLYCQAAKKDSVPGYTFGTVTELEAQFDDIFNDPNFSNAQWGVAIQSLWSGEYIYRRNDNKLFIPASNLKLFTTAAALHLLGPRYSFKTELYIQGKMDGPILNGDLIVRGFGDPSISGRYYNEDVLHIFSSWADSLLELGIDEIKGNIIGDDGAFDDTGLGEGWSWDYESHWYAAPSGALSFNDNCIDINITGSQLWAKPLLTFQPGTKYVMLLNSVKTVPVDSPEVVDIIRERGTNVIDVRGTIHLGNSLKLSASINNPTQYFVVILKDVFQKKGIKINGYALDIDDINERIEYSLTRRVLTHYSPPLSELIKVVNKVSHNLYAEQILKTIGYEKRGFGNANNGLTVCKSFWESIGINVDYLNIVDGSGLSRLNLIAPQQVLTLLNFMYKGKMKDIFFNSLPIAGKDGTLANRMLNSRAEENVHGKTGILGNIRNLSGYLLTGDNEPVAFTIFCNNFTVPFVLVENIQDLICLRLTNFKRK